jgi:hypothetical protein
LALEREKQISFGNDRQKNKGKDKSGAGSRGFSPLPQESGKDEKPTSVGVSVFGLSIGSVTN